MTRLRQFEPRRLALLGLLLAAAVAFVSYAAMMVPVKNLAVLPELTRGRITSHWPAAVIALEIILVFDVALVAFGLRRRRARIQEIQPVRSTVRSRFPAPLRIQSVPRWVLLLTTVVSGGLLAAASYLGMPPLWEKVTWFLLPWVPLFVFEEVWKYRRYGFYAVFLGLAALQVGHLGEHTAQVSQLLMHHGDLSRSHGVFGQLDFETVHFVWDLAIWVAAGLLVYRFWDNKWLWISWIVASIHQVEHIYLFWMNKLDYGFWAHGGISGIMGKGGLIGSPLSRPYLHFLYNFLVVIPMLVGLWDETKRVQDRSAARAVFSD